MSHSAKAGGAQVPVWSSRLAVYLGTVGAAVGLGSIWRFPYLVGSSGGSAFIFAFVLACLLIAAPMLTAELLIGRHARRSPAQAPGAVARASGRSPNWGAIGVLGTIATFLIISYYTVVAGWVLAYSFKCAAGMLTGLPRAEVVAVWHGFLADPWEMAGWHFAFVALVAVISARGLTHGIEVASKVRAPALLVLLLILAAYALATGDVRRGLAFAFTPDFGAITPQVLLVAIGQAFYATGVGMAMMLAYGSYVERGTSLARSAVIVCGSILLVSLLATLIVFPLVFRYDMDPAQGPELVFDVLPTAFAEMPGGRLIGSLFFVLLVLAALTPSLAGLEPIVAWLQHQFGFGRLAAVALAATGIWVLGLGSVLSFNLWSDWRPLGAIPAFAAMDFFGVLDYVSSNLFLPVGALLTSVFVGWRVNRGIVEQQLEESPPWVRRSCVWLLRYVCPLALAGVLVAAFA